MTDATSASEEPAANAIDTGIVSLALVARFHGTAADPAGLSHRFAGDGRAADATELLRAARSLQLKARKVSSSPDRLESLPLPALIQKRDGGGWMVLIRAMPDGRALLHDPLERRPRHVDAAELAVLWSGTTVLVTPRLSLKGTLRQFGISWFVPSLVRYRHLLGEAVLFSAVLNILGLISPLLFQVIIDKVLVHRTLSTLDVVIVALLVVSVFEAVMGGLRSYLLAHTGSRVDVELGSRLYAHALSLPLSYFQARRVGDTVARARELETVRGFLTGPALSAGLDLVFAIAFFAVMFVYSTKLALIALATIPLYATISAVATPLLRRRLDERFERGAEQQAMLVESVSAVETLKSLSVEPRMQSRWEGILAGYVRASLRAQNLASWAGQCIRLVHGLSMALLLWFGAQEVIAGNLTVGELVAVNMLAGRAAGPVLRLAQLWQEIQQVRLSLHRLGDLLNAPPEPGASGSAGRVNPPPIQGAIRFDRVAFKYRADGPRILENISFEIPAGQVVGIVGPSGSGKSTLARLMLRLHNPDTGRVLVDGTDLALVDPAWLRRQVGVVPQESILLNRSVRENIALTAPGASMEAVVRAAKLAGAHEFIVSLAEGYETEIGERGSTLSGGQKQRIAIARALLAEPRILIFDEATSALDYESERAIQDNMRAICRGRTVLIIAHRLAAVRGADRILTLEDGRLTEDGTHGELLKSGGRYAALWRHQVGMAQ